MLIPYIIKISISLAVVYAFYFLLLRRLTFHNSNRWYLLLYSMVSFLIPFINISPLIERSDLKSNDIVRYFPSVQPYTIKVAAESNPWQFLSGWNIVIVLIGIGIVVMLARLITQYISFLRVKRSASLIHDEDLKIYQVDENIIPFSIGNSIFINQKLHEENELKEIIRHEFIHIREKHSIDILWGEFLCLVNWYNPFAWMIRKSIRQNLEFIADKKVLESGLDKKQYQYLLLKVIGVTQFSIANQFNFSSLKKRIAMMNKNRSAKAQLTKFLLLLPILGVVLLAFRQAAGKNFVKEILPTNSLFADTTPKKTPPPPPPPPKPPKPAKEDISINVGNFTATVKRSDGKIEKYDLTKPEEKAVFEKKYGKIIPPPPPPPSPADTATEVEEVVDASEHVTLVADSFVFRDKLSVDEAGDLKWKVKKESVGDPIYLLDGKKVEVSEIKKVLSNKIKSIEVFKNESAIHKYGPEAVHGVINVITKETVAEEVRVIIDTTKFVSGEKANVLYIGVDNPVTIEVEGVDRSNVVVESTGSSIISKKGDKYNIKVTEPEKNIEIRIYERKPNGKLKYINSRYFRTKQKSQMVISADNI